MTEDQIIHNATQPHKTPEETDKNKQPTQCEQRIINIGGATIMILNEKAALPLIEMLKKAHKQCAQEQQIENKGVHRDAKTEQEKIILHRAAQKKYKQQQKEKKTNQNAI